LYFRIVVKTNNSCIRVFADIDQINACKKRLKQVEDSIQKLSKPLSLAGNDVRLKILFLLFEQQKLCVCDLSDILNMTIPAISQHLKKLREGGIVQLEKVAQTIFYSLAPQYHHLFNSYFKLIAKNKILV